MMFRRPSLAALVVSMALAQGASAQSAQSADGVAFTGDRLRPATTKAGVLDVEWGGVGEHLQWDVALWGSYAHNPVVVYNGAERNALVAHRVGANLTANLALFEWVEILADLPVLIFQTRDDASVPNAISNTSLSAVGLGDLRLAPKVRILRSREQFVDVAFIPALTLPSGFPANEAHVGEGQVTFVPEVAISRGFDGGPVGGLRLATNLAVRIRPQAIDVLSTSIGNELVYRGGVGYRFDAFPLEVDASLSGATALGAPFSSTVTDNSLEALGGVSYDVMPFLQLFGGAGVGVLPGLGVPDLRAFAGLRLSPAANADADSDGVVGAADLCPDEPEERDGFKDDDGCPDIDNDGDGIPDGNDACDNEPEDVDGFKDEDGCPDGGPPKDSDNDGVLDDADTCPTVAGLPAHAGCPPPDGDGDGILDAADACPAVPGSVDGCPDQDKDGVADHKDACVDVARTAADELDGCPKAKKLVTVSHEKIELTQSVFFDTGTATIKPESFAILDQVAEVLSSHPELEQVRIEGHTDAEGDAKGNLGLSMQRADSVRAYLVKKGIAAKRLTARGFGATRPMADNGIAAGREKNRRVEFVLGNDAPTKK